MKYLGLDNEGWHLVDDGETRYALTRTKDGGVDPLKGKDGYCVLYRGFTRWNYVRDRELRKRIIMTAWPMCVE